MLIYSSFYMVPKRDRIPRILMDPIKFCPLQLQFGHGRKITREHRTSSNNSPWLALPLPVNMNNVTWQKNIANILMSSGKNIREQLINFAAMQRTCQRPACSGIHSAIQSSYCLACFPWDFYGVITAINLCHLHADYGLLIIFQMSSYSKTQLFM